MIDLNELKKTTLEIGEKRIANGANLNPDFLKHCAGELVEVVNARQEFKTCESLIVSEVDTNETMVKRCKNLKTEYAHELADIIVCVLNEAEVANIDIEKAIFEVVEKNRLRAEGKGDKK